MPGQDTYIRSYHNSEGHAIVLASPEEIECLNNGDAIKPGKVQSISEVGGRESLNLYVHSGDCIPNVHRSKRTVEMYGHDK